MGGHCTPPAISRGRGVGGPLRIPYSTSRGSGVGGPLRILYSTSRESGVGGPLRILYSTSRESGVGGPLRAPFCIRRGSGVWGGHSASPTISRDKLQNNVKFYPPIFLHSMDSFCAELCIYASCWTIILRPVLQEIRSQE